jgi:hypothetical protein
VCRTCDPRRGAGSSLWGKVGARAQSRCAFAAAADGGDAADAADAADAHLTRIWPRLDFFRWHNTYALASGVRDECVLLWRHTPHLVQAAVHPTERSTRPITPTQFRRYAAPAHNRNNEYSLAHVLAGLSSSPYSGDSGSSFGRVSCARLGVCRVLVHSFLFSYPFTPPLAPHHCLGQHHCREPSQSPSSGLRLCVLPSLVGICALSLPPYVPFFCPSIPSQNDSPSHNLASKIA